MRSARPHRIEITAPQPVAVFERLTFVLRHRVVTVARDDRITMLVRTSDGFTIIALEGPFGIECGDRLHRTVLELLKSGQRTFIADLLRVTRLDAAGVGQLARAFTIVTANGGEMALVVGCDQIRELLDTTRLTRLVPTFASIAQAAEGLAPCASC
jgi:anti-anti-sigma factor